MNKERWIFIFLLVQVATIMIWFGGYYAPIRYPAIHEVFELGNWLMGLFLGVSSTLPVIAIALIWSYLGEK